MLGSLWECVDHEIHQCVGEGVRQVAESCNHPIVFDRTHDCDHAPQDLPESFHDGDRARIALRSRGDQAGCSGKEIPTGSSESRTLAAGHRVSSDVISSQNGCELIDNAGLHAARIGDERCGCKSGSHSPRHFFHAAHRGAEHHKIRIFYGIRRVSEDRIG